MKLPVYKQDGSKSADSVELPDAMLQVEPNDHAIWLAVRSEQAAQRQGTAKTKIRKYVRGGGRKPFKQKGRGVARQGTSRSPLMPGGGTIFGPVPHKYHVGVGDKVKKIARLSALVHKAKADKIRIVEDFTMSAPRTKSVTGLFKALGLDAERVLVLTPEYDLNLAKSVRNVTRAHAQKAEAASTLDLMNCSTIVLQKSALPKLLKVLGHAA
ncbi:50S ribosomal protein L4 [candidate division KSB1 bacterium]|nr:50S ribosomal protein L4 [candidate division KSB1 bacterium]